MKIIETDLIDPLSLKPWEREQVYNGLDCCITAEVLDVLLPQLDNHTAATYTFSRDLQGPLMEMKLRGVRVDKARVEEVKEEYYQMIDRLESQLDRIVLEGVRMPSFNWRSNPDLHKLFYGLLGIPAIRFKGKPTVNRNALEKLLSYPTAYFIVSHIIAMRELKKKIDVLNMEIDPDGRMRTSYNIAGTNTGRLSSSYTEFGTGGNLQNIEEAMRSIFIADKGMKMAKFDAKSGESFCVGAIEWNLFKDERYLFACETGDPHTATARICWPELPWTGDLKLDKAIAEEPYYRHYSYRFMCKKLGHGSNYGGAPPTLAQQAKVPVGVVHAFQPKYFSAFPAHLRWHGWVEHELRSTGYLVNLTGRKRYFFGRRDDPATLREAIAYDPQGSLADIVNRAMLRLWNDRRWHLYMHDHDALTIQYPEQLEDDVIPAVQSLLVERMPIEHGRELTIPYDCKVGWNKGEYNAKTNPDGLRDYIPGDGGRKRTPPMSLLDRPVRRTHG